MKLLRWSILVLALPPLAVFAQDSTPDHSRSEGSRHTTGGPGEASTRPYLWGRGFRGSGGLGDESSMRFRRSAYGETQQSDMPSPEQWDEVAAYMQRDLPNTWRHFQGIAEDRKGEMKKQIFAKFRETQQLRERNDTELYELKLKEAKLADDFAGLARDYRRAPLADQGTVLGKLKVKAREITENQLAQRELRIKKLEAQLAQEKERLARAREVVEGTVERRMSELIARVNVRKDDDAKGPPVQGSPVNPGPRK